MKKINETDSLNERIRLLETKQAQELILLREQFHITYESLKPINIIKSTLTEATTSPEIKDNLVNNAIGLATGYLSRKVLMRATHNPIKILLGAILQFAITNIVSKHSDTIKTTGEMLWKRIFKNQNHEPVEKSNTLN